MKRNTQSLRSIDTLNADFKKLFNQEPIVVRTPVVLSLLGEQLDYNLGRSLSLAADVYVFVACCKAEEKNIRLHAAGQMYATQPGNISPALEWQILERIQHVAEVFQGHHHNVQGLDVMYISELDLDSGYSDTASFCVSIAMAINVAFGLDLSKTELAVITQQAVYRSSKLKNGLLEPYNCLLAKPGTLLLLDAERLSVSYFPFVLEDYQLLLMMLPGRYLPDDVHNHSMEECNQALWLIRQQHPEVEKLSEVTPGQLELLRSAERNSLYARSKFLMEESQRIDQAKHCLSSGDISGLGQLLNQSHRGLCEYYELHSPPLDYLATCCHSNAQVLGAKWAGRAFGLSLLAIVNKGSEESINSLSSDFTEKFGQHVNIRSINGVGAAEVICPTQHDNIPNSVQTQA